jgi:hypothetical protein
MKPIAVVFALLLHGLGHASERIPLPPNEIAQSAKIAFIGTVTAVAESDYKPWSGCWEHSAQRPHCGGKLVTFEITEQLRGDISKTAKVLAEDARYCLGPYWKTGAAYVVVGLPVAEQTAQIVAANQCGGTMEFTDDARPLVKALRESKDIPPPAR